MKKSSRHDSPTGPSPRRKRDPRREAGTEGKWEFQANGSLISLGSTEAVRRAAYRTAEGELRFLPL